MGDWRARASCARDRTERVVNASDSEPVEIEVLQADGSSPTATHADEGDVPFHRAPAVAIVVAFLALGALLAVAIALTPGDEAGVVVDEETSTTTDRDRVATTGDPRSDAPAGLALAGRDDGTESVGLPVDAEPRTGLVDDQRVTVTGSGFPAGASGGVLVDFDPSIPLPAPPTVSPDWLDGVRDGEPVEIRVDGLVPDSEVSVAECVDGREACVEIGRLTADAAGVADGTIQVWRSFGTGWGGWEYGVSGSVNADCAREPCNLLFSGEVFGDRIIPLVPLRFTGGDGDRTPPTMRLVDDRAYALGETIEVEIVGLPRGSFANGMICSAETGCSGGGGAQWDGDGPVRLRIPTDAGWGVPCRGGCVVSVSVFHGSSDAGDAPRPPLFPEPVPVTITR